MNKTDTNSINCKNCGEIFKPRNDTHRFCNPKCKADFHKRLGGKGFRSLTMTFLSYAELVDMTGSKQKTKMVKHMIKYGIPHTIGSDGYPRVMRSLLEGKAMQWLMHIAQNTVK